MIAAFEIKAKIMNIENQNRNDMTLEFVGLFGLQN